MESFDLLASQLDYVGKVRCSLYDTIPLTALERQVLDFPEMQRLRRLKQTAFTHYVFPGATHTRFEHSIGVMHMAGIFLTTLVRNQLSLLQGHEKQESFDSDFSFQVGKTQEPLGLLQSNPRFAQTLRFAALLHDVGHAPFSHSGERFLPTWNDVNENLNELDVPAWLKEWTTVKIQKQVKKGKSHMAGNLRHEFYSVLLIEKIFRSTAGPMMGPDMAQDVCSLLDQDIPLRKGSDLETSGLRSLLSEIISGEIDVDRMDYLRRDAKHCGVVYGLFDAGRILDATVFYQNDTTGEYHLALHQSGLAAYEDYLRARMSMYQQVYFHKTGTACEAMLSSIGKKLDGFKLPLDADSYLKFDDSSFYYEVEKTHPQFESAKQEMNDLLFSRKLWKKVYEENHPRMQVSQVPSLTGVVSSYLRKSGVECEQIESETSLSRFSPKGRVSQHSSNTLKIVVKKARRRLNLEPIEDHSRLINSLEEDRVFKRVFVGEQSGERIETIVNDLEDYLSESGSSL